MILESSISLPLCVRTAAHYTGVVGTHEQACGVTRHDHFESVAQVHRWSGEDMAVWLRVRLIGRAQTADTDTGNSYKAVKEALKSRFEPESKRGLYAAEFAARSKKNRRELGELWRGPKMPGRQGLFGSTRKKLSVDRFVNELPRATGCFRSSSKATTDYFPSNHGYIADVFLPPKPRRQTTRA